MEPGEGDQNIQKRQSPRARRNQNIKDKSSQRQTLRYFGEDLGRQREDQSMRTCWVCKEKIKKQEWSKHQWKCQPLCKYCQDKFPENYIHQHEVLCRKNPVTQAMRRQCNDSSYQSSSDQESQEYEDEDGYWSIDPPKEHHSNLQQETEVRINQQEKQRESCFNHKPRREYRLSQSSSEEDERERFWRTYHEEFREIPTSFYVQTLNTDLEGITIAVSSQGRGGRVIRRTVHNRLTGERRTISNHRFQRHYRNHVITNENQENSNGAFILRISNHSQNIEELNSMINHVSIHYNGLTSEQISTLPVISFKKEEQNDNCAICFIEYQEQDKIMKLRCKHRFHEDCVIQWLRQNPLCPLCKAKQN